MANQDYIKLLNDFYKQKPKTPPIFQYSPRQAQADRQSVSAQYSPFYQEQSDIANMQYANTLRNAQNAFSRRGLWGAAVPQGGQASNTLHTTGVPGSAILPGTANISGPGPVSGLRRQGEFQIAQDKYRTQTGIQRDYQTAIEQGVLQRQKEAQDVYQKTVQDPYQQALTDWQNRLLLLQANYYR